MLTINCLLNRYEQLFCLFPILHESNVSSVVFYSTTVLLRPHDVTHNSLHHHIPPHDITSKCTTS